MKQWKITYWHNELGYRNVFIEAVSEEDATQEFMSIIVNANQIGYCRTENA